MIEQNSNCLAGTKLNDARTSSCVLLIYLSSSPGQETAK